MPTLSAIRLGLVALAVAGCGLVETTPPAPTPADFQGIASEIVKRGVTIDHIVSGDAGCDDRVLAPTAIGFDARGLDQPAPVRIYLYIFRDRSTFERLRASIDTCARAYVTDPATLESIEQSPFVIVSQGPWGARFEAVLRQGLQIAAGTGDQVSSSGTLLTSESLQARYGVLKLQTVRRLSWRIVRRDSTHSVANC